MTCRKFCLFILINTLLLTKSFALNSPYGVNFGGLYVLEDWFFSNSANATYVATPCGDVVGNSDEFIIDNNGIANIPFSSETDLIRKLKKSGKSDSEILQYFQTHRARYFQESSGEINVVENNFQKLKSLGISDVRLPITWAITYDQPYQINNGTSLQTIPGGQASVIIPDPFHYKPSEPYSWASIPASDIEHILGIASDYDIQVLIDVHAYPGGSGGGTYNGVWPLAPMFWTTSKTTYQQNFQTIVGNLVNWANRLKQTNYKAYQALLGITPMNEPAHLLATPNATCNSNPATATWLNVGYQNVLETMALATTIFKNSDLPSDGKKLYMNIIETAIPETAPHNPPFGTIGNWWKNETGLTNQDRKTWAYLDIHHYFAWDSKCNQCLQKDVVNNVIQSAAFSAIEACAQDFYSEIRTDLGFDRLDLLATSEFSASTNSNTVESCASHVAPTQLDNWQEFRDYVYNIQLEKGKAQNINMFFWTWKLPYNHNFQNEWSLHTIHNQQTLESGGLSTGEITAISVAAASMVTIIGYALASMFF